MVHLTCKFPLNLKCSILSSEVTAAPVAPPAKKKKPARKQRKPAQFLKPDLPNIVLSGTFPVSVDTLHETVAGDNITYIKQWYEDHLATGELFRGVKYYEAKLNQGQI